jgi:hypothetical protein
MQVNGRYGMVLWFVVVLSLGARSIYADCQKSAIDLGQTVIGSFDSNTCYGGPAYHIARFYQFHALAGQTVVAKATVTEPVGVGMFIILGGPSDSTFGSATSPNEATTSYTVPQTGNYVVGVDAQGPVTSSSYSLSLDIVSTGLCSPDLETLCLEAGRFQATTSWKTQDGRTGSGKAVQITNDAGYFSFFDTANVEVFVKVLDACTVNARRWVFGGGLTDVEVAIEVTDTATGTTQMYSNPLGTAFQPIQDTGAFSCPSP